MPLPIQTTEAAAASFFTAACEFPARDCRLRVVADNAHRCFLATNTQTTFRPFYCRCRMPVIAVDDRAGFIHRDGPVVLLSVARLTVRRLAGQLPAGWIVAIFAELRRLDVGERNLL